MGVFEFALPYHEGLPAFVCQVSQVLFVAITIAQKFRQPEFLIRSGNQAFFAVVKMPEASVNENYLAPRREYQVGLSWEIGAVKAEAIAKPVHEAPDLHFRRSVLASNRPHVLAAIHAGSLLELGLEPIQDCSLLVYSCATDLRQKPILRRRYSFHLSPAI
jgi:hypothetical protein